MSTEDAHPKAPPTSWEHLAQMQRAMLVRIAREGPQTVASKTEARTASSLRSRELLRPGYPRQDGRDAQGRWYLTAKGRRLIAERGALEAAPPLIPENGGWAGIRFREGS